jgi:ABC-2 type transport system permease protein
VFDLRYPGVGSVVLFLVSLAFAVVVSFGFRFLYNSAAFWLVDIRGVVTLSITVSIFFSGMLLPLSFFPSWLRTVAQALPFASALQTPIDVWLGKYDGVSLFGVLALQVFWALVLLGLGRLALRAGARKLVVQGG